MNLEETGLEDVDKVNLVQDWDHLSAVVNREMNHQASYTFE
jgi:hypothetical protein